MRVVILGAGLMGVTSAWELARQGHEVTVIERTASVAEETSAANAGLIAPGHAFAWASPQVPGILLRSLYRNDQAFRIRLNLDRDFWRWTAQFLAQCTDARARANTRRKHALCVYSQACMQELTDATGLEYQYIPGGILYLHRSQATLDRGAAHMKLLEDLGQDVRIVDAREVARLDPAYRNAVDRIAGAIHCPTDASGNSRLFCVELARHCRELGVSFHCDTELQHIVAAGDQVTCVRTSGGEFSADAYLLALGPQSPLFARQAGDRLPVYPVKGYSMTVGLQPDRLAPTLGVVDEDNLVAWSRLGDELRATAVAEFAGYDLRCAPADCTTMLDAVDDLLPGATDRSRATFRACLRPMTPRGTPVFGRGRLANLYYNTGQGHMGWTMACGSARIATDLLQGRDPDIDVSVMTLDA